MITLVLGGARSGKSALAERLALRAGAPATYLATFVATGADSDMATRIDAHRARRDPRFTTVEAGADLPGAVRDAPPGPILIDALGTWVAGQADPATVDGAACEALCAALVAHDGEVVVVSDEVGLSVHPETEAGRRFRDTLGSVNQRVAETADEVLLVVAGRVVRLDAFDELTGP